MRVQIRQRRLFGAQEHSKTRRKRKKAASPRTESRKNSYSRLTISLETFLGVLSREKEAGKDGVALSSANTNQHGGISGATIIDWGALEELVNSDTIQSRKGGGCEQPTPHKKNVRKGARTEQLKAPSQKKRRKERCSRQSAPGGKGEALLVKDYASIGKIRRKKASPAKEALGKRGRGRKRK